MFFVPGLVRVLEDAADIIKWLTKIKQNNEKILTKCLDVFQKDCTTQYHLSWQIYFVPIEVFGETTLYLVGICKKCIYGMNAFSSMYQKKILENVEEGNILHNFILESTLEIMDNISKKWSESKFIENICLFCCLRLGNGRRRRWYAAGLIYFLFAIHLSTIVYVYLTRK